MIREAIISYFLEKVLDLLPRWLIRCFVSPSKIASEVDIDLRRINPITISFGTEIPRIDIYFRISNLSSFNLVLDRLLIDLWVGQPTLRGTILVRYDLPKRSGRDDIYFRDQLTVSQQEQIRKYVSGQLISLPVTVYVKAYFESKIGFIDIDKTLEHREVPVR